LAEGDAETWDCWSGSARSLVEHLRHAGHEVVVRDVECYGADRWLAAALTCSWNRRRWSSRFHLGSVPFRLRTRRAARHIARHRDSIDVIVQIGGTFEPAGRGEVPYVVYSDSNIRMAERGAGTGHSDASSLTPAELSAVHGREARVYGDADLVLAMSDYLRQSFIDDFSLPAARVLTVHAGLNMDLSRIVHPRPARGSWPPTILFVGRQFERKGGDVLLAAFEGVRAELPDARLVIIGPASVAHVPPGVNALGFLDKSTLAGWETLSRAYAEADVFCLPTRFEPFGISFLEAMFFGLPCVGTNAWAIPEMVSHGETGLLVPVDDAAALAESLLLILRNPELGRTLGAAGRRRAESYFTWDAVVHRVEEGIMPLTRAAASLAPGRS
jgi:glycosyltransferase involved in cell wall biosynthesis